MSEIGSLSLEFTKLSQLTGDMRYYDAGQRISDEFAKSQMKTKLPGMWPIVIDAKDISFTRDNAFTLGGMSDSAYEYFPKQYLLLGGALQQPREMYEKFIPVAKKHLFRRGLNEHNIPILFSGDVRITGSRSETKVITTPKAQHLTCFAGGMVGLGAKLFNIAGDMAVAKQLTDGCVWSYNATASGIGPEVFSFAACGNVDDEQTGEKCSYTEKKWHDSLQIYWGGSSAAKVAGADSNEPDPEERIQGIIKQRRLAPGMLEINDRRYILRPEAIEAVFMMLRLTGDRSWEEKAWVMVSTFGVPILLEHYTPETSLFAPLK